MRLYRRQFPSKVPSATAGLPSSRLTGARQMSHLRGSEKGAAPWAIEAAMTEVRHRVTTLFDRVELFWVVRRRAMLFEQPVFLD